MIPRQQSGEHTGPRRHADRIGAIGSLKQRAPGSESVQIRGLNARVTGASHMIRTHFIDTEYENIWPVGHENISFIFQRMINSIDPCADIVSHLSQLAKHPTSPDPAGSWGLLDSVALAGTVIHHFYRLHLSEVSCILFLPTDEDEG